VESGILGPGDITADGRIIDAAHGARFGDGIYLSPLPEKAAMYSFSMENYSQMFVSVVLLGRANKLEFFRDIHGRRYPIPDDHDRFE